MKVRVTKEDIAKAMELCEGWPHPTGHGGICPIAQALKRSRGYNSVQVMPTYVYTSTPNISKKYRTGADAKALIEEFDSGSEPPTPRTVTILPDKDFK